MTWLPLILLATLADAGKQLLQKELTAKIDPGAIAVYVSLVYLGVFAVGFVLTGIPEIEIVPFVVSLLVTSGVGVYAAIQTPRAFRDAELSLISPLYAFSPAFSFLPAFVLLGESPATGGLVGLAMILAGAYALNLRGAGVLTPVYELVRSAGQRRILSLCLLYGFSSVAYKAGMEASAMMFFLFVNSVLIALGVLPLFCRRVVRNVGPQNALRILPLGILAVTTNLLSYGALLLGPVVYVLSVKRMSALYVVLLSGLVFRERGIGWRFACACLMVAGVLLITLMG